FISVTLDALAFDDTGNRLFVSTDSGIVTVNLSPLPVSIGSLTPTQGLTSGGDSLIIRGSNFQNGATVTLGTTTVSATWVDQNTLRCVSPAGAPGQALLSVKNPDGSTYSLPAAFTYATAMPDVLAVDPKNVLTS